MTGARAFKRHSFKRHFGVALTRYGRFNHEAHLYVAWALLRELPALSALAAYRDGLRRLAQDMGLSGKYHETLTVTWVMLVLERLSGSQDEPWEAFIARHPELLDARLPERFYAPGVLSGPEARESFVPPSSPAL